MTNFAFLEERREERRRAEKENAFNAELCRMLTRTKEESVASLYENLTFIVGVSTVLPAQNTAERGKVLVF